MKNYRDLAIYVLLWIILACFSVPLATTVLTLLSIGGVYGLYTRDIPLPTPKDLLHEVVSWAVFVAIIYITSPYTAVVIAFILVELVGQSVIWKLRRI